MKILNLITDKKTSKYMKEDFLVLMDTFISYLRKNKEYDRIELDNLDSWRNEGDVLSLLNELNVRYSFWPIVCRFNDILNNGDLVDDLLSIDVPKENILANIYSTYKTKSSK